MNYDKKFIEIENKLKITTADLDLVKTKYSYLCKKFEEQQLIDKERIENIENFFKQLEFQIPQPKESNLSTPPPAPHHHSITPYSILMIFPS